MLTVLIILIFALIIGYMAYEEIQYKKTWEKIQKKFKDMYHED